MPPIQYEIWKLINGNKYNKVYMTSSFLIALGIKLVKSEVLLKQKECLHKQNIIN